MTGSNYEIQSTEIFEKLGWEKIEIILKRRQHIMTFKALRGETPNYLSDLFVASLEIKILWSTVSKAFLRSRNKKPLIRPLSILIRHWLAECRSVVSVEDESLIVGSLKLNFLF
jgi:hypothetical protein